MWRVIVEPGCPQKTTWRVLDTLGYKYTLIFGNTRCFSTATMVARTHLNITL